MVLSGFVVNSGARIDLSFYDFLDFKSSNFQDPLAVVDRICGEMAASRAKREQRRNSEERPHHVDNDTALSREALEKHAQDDTMAREVVLVLFQFSTWFL